MFLHSRHSQLIKLTLLLALGCSPALAQGGTPGGQGGTPGGRLTPAQQQKIFPGLRSLSLKAAQDRLAILQKYQTCLKDAPNMKALRTCQQQERQASMAQRQQFHLAMKALYDSNGIPMPQPQSSGGQ